MCVCICPGRGIVSQHPVCKAQAGKLAGQTEACALPKYFSDNMMGKEACLAFRSSLNQRCGDGSPKCTRGGAGGKKPTNHQNWKMIKSVCDLAAECREAFCSKGAKLEDPTPDQPFHFPASNF